MKEDYLIICDGTGITIWTIPPLHSVESRLAFEVQTIEPQYRVSLQNDIPPDIQFNYESLAEWYTTVDEPFHFDFVMCRDGIVELTRYRLDFVSSSSAASDKPTEVPGDLTKIITFRVPEDDGYLEEYRVANGHIVMYWSAPTGLNIQTAPIKANETVTSGLEPRTAIYEMRMVERYLSALCSASGRLCYLVEPDLIEVVDFLPNGNQHSTRII